jgi:hypothetical protein
MLAWALRPNPGPGSGEGIGHLFLGWDKTDKELKQHTVATILSAAEIDTLSALKSRQASTLFPELRKAWMGEPLGFAYVDKEKRLTVPRHSYRLCLITGIQPANAAPILRAVSDQTRQHVGRVLEQDKSKNNQARAHAEADRAILVDNRLAEHTVQRVGRWIVRKLDEAADWVSHADLRRRLFFKDRDYFEDAIEALKVSGQIEERKVKSGQSGIEYRRC